MHTKSLLQQWDVHHIKLSTPTHWKYFQERKVNVQYYFAAGRQALGALWK